MSTSTASTASVSRTAALASIGPESAPARVVGDALERMHPATHRIIQTLFPQGTSGDTFVFALLNNATVEYCESAGGYVASVNVGQGCAELSRRVRLSYDTTHMYLVIYQVLGLFSYEKSGDHKEIRIPLEAYQPPAELAETLRQLQAHYSSKRPRMLSLVKRIIEQITPFLQPKQTEERREQDAQHAALLLCVQRAMHVRGIADPDGQHAMSIVMEIEAHALEPAGVMTTSRTEMEKLEGQAMDAVSPSRVRELALPATPKESIEVGRSEQSDRQQHTPNLFCALPAPSLLQSVPVKAAHASAMTDDSDAAQRIVVAPPEEQHPLRSSVPPSAKRSRFLSLNPHLPPRQPLGKLMKASPSEQQRGEKKRSVHLYAGESGGVDSKYPDHASSGRVDSAKILPFIGIGDKNTITTTQSLSDPDPVQAEAIIGEGPSTALALSLIPHPSTHRQARTLAHLIEGGEKNVGAYIALLKDCDPWTLRAAVIATFLRKYFPGGMGALKKPGGYFTRRVQQYKHSVPEQITALVEQYAQASLEEIDAALQRRAQVGVAKGFAAPARAFQPMFHSRGGKPLDEASATALAQRIQGEDPYVQVKGTSRVADGTYAVKVYIDPVEYDFYTVEDWEIYHAEMQVLDQEEVISR